VGTIRWARRKRLVAALIVSGLVFIPYLCSRILSPWRCISVHAIPPVRPTLPSPDGFRILTYNIAHGRGLVESNWKGGSDEERMQRLDRIAGLLRSIDADVVVLNEVDFDSSWSDEVNQAHYLAQHAGYGYWAEQRNLDFRVLFWKWRFGNALLSKYPIASADVVDLPGFSTWETFLAGKKRGVACDILMPNRSVRVVGVHLSHRSEDTRVRSAILLTNLAKSAEYPLVLTGDLNSTPPGFPLSTDDDGGVNAIAVLDDCTYFQRKPASPPLQHQLTYPSTNAQSVIDWILIPRHWRFATYHVTSSALSDHRPVYADVRFSGSKRITPD